MRVIMEDDVFEQGTVSALALIGLFRVVLSRRHGLVLDMNRPKFKAWLSGRSPDDQRELGERIRDCAAWEALHPSDVEVRVLPGEDGLKTAETALTARACVFLENNKNDWHFLMAVATPEARAVLKRAKDEDLLEVVKCGGIDDMPKDVNEPRRGHPSAARKFAMTDSDRLYPEDQSSKAWKIRQGLEDLVGDKNLRFLNRRSIENYLPEQAITEWVNEHTGDSQTIKQERRRCYAALSSSAATSALSHHYNLKAGLNGDHKRIKSLQLKKQIDSAMMVRDPENPDELLIRGFEQLPSDIREGLRRGFSGQIANHYTSHHQWYLDNDDWCPEEVRDEFTPFLMRVIRAL